MKHLTRADEILLVAILVLRDGAYSTTIQQEVSGRADKSVSVGSLWVSLDHLAERGYVRKGRRKKEGGGGGRPRVYYRITPKGIRALKRIREHQDRLWAGVPDASTWGAPARSTA